MSPRNSAGSWMQKSIVFLYVAMTRASARLYLPYLGFVEGDKGMTVGKANGDYSVINDRLKTIDAEMN